MTHPLIEELERVVRGDQEGEAYHGPALAHLLAGIDAAAAGARPIPRAHSILEIVRHLAAWAHWAAGALQGPTQAPAADGWGPPPGDGPEAPWTAALQDLERAHEALLARARALGEAPSERERSILRFALHHTLHHGGQIALLRRAESPGSNPPSGPGRSP